MDSKSVESAYFASAGHGDDTRLKRFGDWISVPKIAESANPVRSIYRGGHAASRMDIIRRTIEYIRENWSDYPKFVQILRDHIQSQPDAYNTGKEERDLIDSILSTRKEWLDRQVQPSTSDNFDVIHLYTSGFGYDQIFSLLNSALRTDDLTEHHSLLQAIVFLIELLNIDLYNFLSTNPSAAFQGLVFRGVSLHRDQIQEFKNVAAMPVRDRYWGVPLSMMSASTSAEVALKFARIDANNCATHRPFLWRIHVADLDPALLKIYHDQFPRSVVTTLCAIPIYELSKFQEEGEVLLRGPWFQLIRVVDEVIDGYGSVLVMDLVMLNANRDHPSTSELGQHQHEARKLFACLVGMGRAAVCKQVAEKYQLVDDAVVYGEMFDEQQKKLSELLEGPQSLALYPRTLFPKLWVFLRTYFRDFIRCFAYFRNWSGQSKDQILDAHSKKHLMASKTEREV